MMKKVFAGVIAICIITTLKLFLFPKIVYAVCPVCTVAVVAGLGISRELGVDDTVTSIWIGGLILSMSFWSIDWIERSRYREKIYKHICKFKCGMTEFQALNLWTILIMYLFVIIPLIIGHVIGIKRNTLWGIDKIILGIFIGSLLFLAGIAIDKKIRKTRNGKQLFHFQKVVFPIISLLLGSLLIYLITK